MFPIQPRAGGTGKEEKMMEKRRKGGKNRRMGGEKEGKEALAFLACALQVKHSHFQKLSEAKIE